MHKDPVKFSKPCSEAAHLESCSGSDSEMTEEDDGQGPEAQRMFAKTGEGCTTLLQADICHSLGAGCEVTCSSTAWADEYNPWCLIKFSSKWGAMIPSPNQSRATTCPTAWRLSGFGNTGSHRRDPVRSEAWRKTQNTCEKIWGDCVCWDISLNYEKRNNDALMLRRNCLLPKIFLT